jgi:preprotein translocase subunit YajC
MNFVPALTVFFSLAASTFAQGASGSNFSAGSFIPMMLVMFVVIYFFMIRPEQKKQKEKLNLLSSLKKGDKVLTIGGIHGTVGSIKDDTVMVRIGDNNTTVKFAKSAITTIITSKDDEKNATVEKGE